MRYLAVLFAAMALVSCSTAQVVPEVCGFKTAKRIAVVSLLGDEFHMVRVATTVFGNVSYDVSVPEWEIDSHSERRAIAWLRDRHPATALALALDKAQRMRFLQSQNRLISQFDYGEMLLQAKAQGADAIVVLKGIRSSNFPFHKPGYGFFERTFLGSERRCVYSSLSIAVVSASSGDVWGGEFVTPCEAGERELPWREKFEEYSAAERNALRARTEASLDAAVAYALDSAYFRTGLMAERVCGS